MGASVVVCHPENARKDRRVDLQLLTLQNVRRLQRDAGNVAVGLETFGGPRVALTYEDIRDLELDMVLDTSHLFASRSLEIVETYAAGILVVHLSEPPSLPGHTPHMQVGPVCHKVLERLRQKRWQGIITLEYMPHYHCELLRDRAALERELGG